jgi:hypothetical protein
MELEEVLRAIEDFVEWYEKNRKIRRSNNANRDYS